MRAIFTVASLLIVLAIVGVLAKKQLGTVSGTAADAQVPGAAISSGATVPEQSRQIQQQVRQAVETSMQQARPMPDEK